MEEETKEAEHDEEAYILQFPDHIILEIFCRMTTSTILRCRFVCKSWLYLLSDPYFTRSLFLRTPTSLIVCGAGLPKNYYLVGLDKASRLNGDLSKLSGDLITFDSGFSIKIVGSCNGCLCLYDSRRSGHSLHLANPITSESLVLPQHDTLFPVCGFGFSPISNVYKVVLFRTPTEEDEELSFDGYEAEVMVLTVGSTVWRSIGHHVYPSGDGHGVYLNGFLHWVGNISDWICAFDVECERFQHLPPPLCSFEGCFEDFKLSVSRGCLSLMVPMGLNIGVWVMQDYGAKESWVKEFEIVNAFDQHIPHVLKFAEEGQVLMVHNYQLKAYTPRKMGFSRFEVDGLPVMVESGCAHIPSFVSLTDIIRG